MIGGAPMGDDAYLFRRKDWVEFDDLDETPPDPVGRCSATADPPAGDAATPDAACSGHRQEEAIDP
jgi:hypothetical protein